MKLAALIIVLTVLHAAVAYVGVRLSVWAYNHGLNEGYTKGRREIDEWWVKMDSQLDEEWLKIWRQER